MSNPKKRLFLLVSLVFGAVLYGCVNSDSAKLEKNKETVHSFNDAVNNKQFELLKDLVAADFVRHSQATPDMQVKSLEEFVQLQEGFLKVLPDQRVTIENTIAEGEYVAILATYSGTQEGPMPPFPASGKKAQIKFLGLFR